MRDRTNIRDALENHEENKNKDLSSTIREFVSLECTPQVRSNCLGTVTDSLFSFVFFISFMTFCVLIVLIDHVYISLAFDFIRFFLAYSI